jgi:hypothetical protein
MQPDKPATARTADRQGAISGHNKGLLWPRDKWFIAGKIFQPAFFMFREY